METKKSASEWMSIKKKIDRKVYEALQLTWHHIIIIIICASSMQWWDDISCAQRESYWPSWCVLYCCCCYSKRFCLRHLMHETANHRYRIWSVQKMKKKRKKEWCHNDVMKVFFPISPSLGIYLNWCQTRIDRLSCKNIERTNKEWWTKSNLFGAAENVFLAYWFSNYCAIFSLLDFQNKCLFHFFIFWRNNFFFFRILFEYHNNMCWCWFILLWTFSSSSPMYSHMNRWWQRVCLVLR